MKQLKIRIRSNGTVEAETVGIKGRSCLDYVKVLEKMAGASAIESDYTSEYYERDNLLTDTVNAEVRNHG